MAGPRTTRAAQTEKAAEAVEPAAAEPAAPRRRKYLPAEERRRQIILAAQEVFSRTNLQGARTRDIAKAADVNQATLFEHFDSKEALFHAAVVEPLIAAMQGMYERAQAYQAAATTEELLGLAQASAQNHIASTVDIFPLLTASLFSDADLGKRLYCDEIVPLLKQRGEVLNGLLKDDIDPEFAGLALFGILFAVAMDQTFRGRTDDPAQLARQLVQFAALGFLKDRDAG
ncbi:TetR/AcrR family transcriptional regulator [Phenylobacterium sp. LjRoot219]|uniref:TetR/AcrR family transcriptional regulator n=1 Tax=Phenylobacterium sp. LjRoot219 TaxID=3342283 RepID=UPI003ECE4A1F